MRSEDNHVDSDDWYGIFGEIFKRFAPEAELRNIERHYRDDPDRADAAINVASALWTDPAERWRTFLTDDDARRSTDPNAPSRSSAAPNGAGEAE